MRCPFCNAKIAGIASFCITCRAKLPYENEIDLYRSIIDQRPSYALASNREKLETAVAVALLNNPQNPKEFVDDWDVPRLTTNALQGTQIRRKRRRFFLLSPFNESVFEDPIFYLWLFGELAALMLFMKNNSDNVAAGNSINPTSGVIDFLFGFLIQWSLFAALPAYIRNVLRNRKTVREPKPYSASLGSQAPLAQQLLSLNDLMERGILSPDEFNLAKKKLLEP